MIKRVNYSEFKIISLIHKIKIITASDTEAVIFVSKEAFCAK